MPSTLTATPPAGGSAATRKAARSGLIGVALLLALVAALALSLTVGARTTTLPTVLEALTSADPGNGDHAVVLARIPRTITGLLVGAALGMAGAGMQGIARNPLADPGVLGVNAGAALAVVAGIYVFGAATINVFMWFAFAGAAIAAFLVYAVASIGREGATPIKLALAGAAFAAGFSSIMNAVLMLSQEALDNFRFWHVGTLGARTLDEIAQVAPYLALGAVIVLFSGRSLNALSLGDDAARGLGINVNRARIIAGVGVVLLCGAAVALAGPIAFVGLVIPHAIRLLVGSSYHRILPLSMLAGPVLLLGADVVGRVILPPSEVQVGVMTALIGAPVFIWLIRSRKKVGL
ncbi:iron complex transport system permease protein [Neomicrococcus aestuarii]|uniref:Iron complex transport system permease protein n=1 Tax=Neomicrococcus aestuarii TaxID=556325 RepID=A0A7W8TWN4_9MICC|nr:iron ABC transporter permease [Neomicrococcus aestuarii]MBB5512866.1 iron complex transport system permease protein [Neomicrococcus aestuarii]